MLCLSYLIKWLLVFYLIWNYGFAFIVNSKFDPNCLIRTSRFSAFLRKEKSKWLFLIWLVVRHTSAYYHSFSDFFFHDQSWFVICFAADTFSVVRHDLLYLRHTNKIIYYATAVINSQVNNGTLKAAYQGRIQEHFWNHTLYTHTRQFWKDTSGWAFHNSCLWIAIRFSTTIIRLVQFKYQHAQSQKVTQWWLVVY